MVDLFDEIKEDVARERYADLWNKHGKFIIGAAVAVVLGTAFGVFFKDHMRKTREAEGDMLFTASMQVEENDYKAAAATLDDLITGGSKEMSAIARLNKAAALIDEGKNAEAVDIYKEMAGDAGTPKELTQVAELLYIYYQNSEGFSAIESLKKLNNDDNPFRYSVAEMLASKYLETGNKKEALNIFGLLLQDKNTPSNMRRRANEMVEALGIASEPDVQENGEKSKIEEDAKNGNS